MNARIGLREVWEIWLSYDIAVWCGVFAAIGTYIIELILYKKNIIFSGEEKRIEKAKKAGNVIKASQVKCRYYNRSDGGRHYVARYEYDVDGVKKEKVVSANSRLPFSVTLYYEKTPDKVFSDYDKGRSPLKPLMLVIPILVAAAVMKAMGYNP